MTVQIIPNIFRGNEPLERVIKSMMADIQAIKTSVDSINTLDTELRTDHATFKSVVDDLKTAVNGLISGLGGDYLDSTAALAIGSTKPNVANGAFEYHVNGVEYSKAAVAAGTALSGSDIPQALYGAWALDIGADGTIDITPATNNATGYASAVLAAAGLPAVAADHVRMGYVTATKSDAVFDPGTTDLDAANTTVAYTSATPHQGVLPSSVSSSAPATITASAPTPVGSLGTEVA